MALDKVLVELSATVAVLLSIYQVPDPLGPFPGYVSDLGQQFTKNTL